MTELREGLARAALVAAIVMLTGCGDLGYTLTYYRDAAGNCYRKHVAHFGHYTSIAQVRERDCLAVAAIRSQEMPK